MESRKQEGRRKEGKSGDVENKEKKTTKWEGMKRKKV